MPYKKSRIAEQIEQEHACLKRDMGNIKNELSRDVIDEDFADWRLELIWRLRDFRNHLCKHFDLEEEGGFMTEITEEAPERVSQVNQLESEHGQILADLDGILTDLKHIELKDSSRLEDVRKRVTELISTLGSHEAAENELIQKVYYREYGYPA